MGGLRILGGGQATANSPFREVGSRMYPRSRCFELTFEWPTRSRRPVMVVEASVRPILNDQEPPALWNDSLRPDILDICRFAKYAVGPWPVQEATRANLRFFSDAAPRDRVAGDQPIRPVM